MEKTLDAKTRKFSRNYWWNAGEAMRAKMEPTRKGFGQSPAEDGDDERVVCLGLDISGSITISDFYAGKPERKKRWLSMGIAEQSATSAAAGLAREGKLPVLGTYATFAAPRNLDQMRTSACYGNFNLLIAGAPGGVSAGPDGAMHQALERFVCYAGPAEHVCGRSLRRSRDSGDHLSAAAAQRTKIRSLRREGDPRCHE